MKIVFIAEKPLMAQAIATALSPSYQKKDGYLEGSNHLIFTWALGHLVELSEFEVYDEKYKKWVFKDLPFIPESFKLSPIASKKAQLMKIKGITHDADLIINATDAAIEGQVIYHYIAAYLKLLNKPTKRLWPSSLTPEAIQTAYKNMKDDKFYSPLLAAGICRSQADYLIGLNATRAFTLKTGGGELISVGRIQTSLLAMIYDRCNEHFAFIKRKYYPIQATFEQNGTVYSGKWIGEQYPNKEVAGQIAQKVKNHQGLIKEFKKKRTKEAAPKFYSLSLLQKEANKKYGYSAKDILDSAQSLYEKHKCISYPRTSSSYVTKAEIPGMHKVFALLEKSNYRDYVAKGNPDLVHSQNKALCDENKVDDHHAILPTDKQPEELSEKEQNIYDLIIRRFLTHFLEPAIYEKYAVLTEVCGETFKTNASYLLNTGWRELYIDEKDIEDEEITIAMSLSLLENEKASCTATDIQERETKPLPLYTEGTLIDAMKKAGTKVEDEEARELMKHSGIGTESTRAATIELLKARNYIQPKGKALLITDKGKFVIETIRKTKIQTLTSADYTGEWEKRLKRIKEQTYSPKEFMAMVRKFTETIVSEAGEIKTSYRGDKVEISTCPKCKNGVIIEGKKAYGCSLWKDGCNFTIWKKQFGKMLSVTQAKTLIEKRETGSLSFTNKNDVKYKAKLKLTSDWEIVMEYTNKAKS